LDISKYNIAELVDEFIDNHRYFYARSIAKWIWNEKLGRDQRKTTITNISYKVKVILFDRLQTGVIAVYKQSSNGNNLYKKIIEKEVKDNV